MKNVRSFLDNVLSALFIMLKFVIFVCHVFSLSFSRESGKTNRSKQIVQFIIMQTKQTQKKRDEREKIFSCRERERERQVFCNIFFALSLIVSSFIYTPTS